MARGSLNVSSYNLGASPDACISARAGNIALRAARELKLVSRRHAAIRYALSMLLVGTLAAATHLNWPLLNESRSVLLFSAVIICALYGGFGPALAGLLCAVAVVRIGSGISSVAIGGSDLIRWLPFVTVALLVSWMSSSRRRAQIELRRSQSGLEVRVEERTAALALMIKMAQLEVEERRRHEEALQKLASQLLTAEQHERRRLAVKLHDGIGQLLAVAQMSIDRALQEPSPPLNLLSDIRSLIIESVALTRSITIDLSPPILYEAGLRAALEWLANQMIRKHHLTVDLHVGAEPAGLDEDMRVLLFSSIRELLMNVVKHAHVDRASVGLIEKTGRIQVTVDDEGAGFDAKAASAQTKDGFGLFNVGERIGHVGGTFSLSSQAGRGTHVVLEIPRRQSAVLV